MRRELKPTITIERGRGATYSNGEWTAYEHSMYPRHSVLSGQPRRVYLESFDTLEAATAAYPQGRVIQGTTYQPPYLGHLSADGDL
jgi:hypothetical protein